VVETGPRGLPSASRFFLSLVFADLLLGPEAAHVTELLEGETQRVHLPVAFPAVFLPGHPHPRPQRAVRLVGKLGIDGDRHVGDALAEELFADPSAAMDGVVVGVVRLRH